MSLIAELTIFVFLGSASEGAQQSLQEVYHKVWVFFVTAVFKDYKPDIYLYSKNLILINIFTVKVSRYGVAPSIAN
jgi:hypothetical protein